MSLSGLKRLLVGESLPTSAHTEERLNNAAALAILASDALSSVAYATEETLLVLIAAGTGALTQSFPISIAIITLLIIVILSYRQTIKAYPNGGGSYIVARENLGLLPGLIAGASLMIDYVLTVTVSIASGVDNLTSAIPQLRSHTVIISLIFICLLMIANLRGVKESGKLFMIPTYTFVASIFIMIIVGLYHYFTGDIHPQAIIDHAQDVTHHQTTEALNAFLILRAFAAGCAALTGVEAISDGVLAFKPPEWKNARLTLLFLGLILGFMFLGITIISNIYHIVPDPAELASRETVVSKLAHYILGNGLPYYFVQISTLLVLLLAANTSYADFPRLCYFLARDGFLPRQLAILGDRLVYSNGIIFLSAAAAILIIISKGSVSAIIPLYAVGVFTSFTLSQAGMVTHWYKEKSTGWRPAALMNGLGALATFIVLGVVIYTKFLLGAWTIVIAIPLSVWLLISIRKHYDYVAKQLSIQDLAPRSYLKREKPTEITHPAIVIVGQLNKGTVEALDYARTIADEIIAVHVDMGGTDIEKLQEKWANLEADIKLEIVPSPYRSVIEPIVDFVNEFESKNPELMTTIIIPVFVTKNWWEELLHNQTSLFLKMALRARKRRVVTTVRYYL